MKLLQLSLLLLFSILSCSIDSTTDKSVNPLLQGEWQLVKVCWSAGTGGCEKEENLLAPNYNETLTILVDSQSEIDGRATGTFTINNEGRICSGTFIYDGGTDMDMVPDAESECSFDDALYYFESVTENELRLSPRCFEGCPHIYSRI